MARIAGVNIPLNKRVEVGLTYIYGVGPSKAKQVLGDLSIDPNTYVKDLTEDEIRKLRDVVDNNLTVEGDLRLPRAPPPSRAPGRRPAHQDQRAHAQGSEAHVGCRQEEGEEVVAQQRGGRARGRRKPRKNIPFGQAHIKTSFNNTIVSLTDRDG